jgi:predicted RNase H-like nuclease (RuvC/YqgF family)
MDWTAIIIAIIVAIGSGGIGGAVVKWLSNREVTKADAYQMLSNVYERRLSALTDRATQLENRVASLEGVIKGLKLEVDERDDMIDTLQKENAELKAEIKQLKAENLCKDEKIAVLQEQVACLTKRLDAMNNKGYDG